VGLAELVESPFRVPRDCFGQPGRQAIDPVAAHAPCHRCSGPQSAHDQGYVFVAESESVVTHAAYGTIVPQDAAIRAPRTVPGS
jgi:hypothetical protein